MSATALSEILPLGAWQNFYVIVGSSAGALTGLTFIVITIAADAANLAPTPGARLTGLRAFITPTAVHFGAALWVAALMSVPGQTGLTLALCLAATGLLGALYCGNVTRLMLELRPSYKPFIADWIWSVVLPMGAYLALLAAAMLLRAHVLAALLVAAADSMLLLLLGIHNAWDVVVWMTTERHTRSHRTPQEERPPPSGTSASKQSAD
jgi:hypothetical protein